MSVYAVMVVQYFDSDNDTDPTHDDAWAEGMAVQTKNFTQETAAQTALVARGTAAERTSWSVAGRIEADGTLTPSAAWYMDDQGTVQQGTPPAPEPEPVDPEPGGYPAWEPWSGLNEDLHQPGDRVNHNGQDWESTTANNHWEPGVFGWVAL